MTYDPAARRNTPLAQKLKETVRANGPITIAEYMSRCLWDDTHGYYATQNVLGKSGDFITAAEISQVFGELIGLWSAIVWREAMGAPARLTLAEYGPGRGTMMRDCLRAARVVPGFHKATRAHLVEMSPALVTLQRATLEGCGVPTSWAQNLAGFPTPAIILANEFLDAWPLQQWIKSNGGWKARGVGVDQSGALSFAEIESQPPPELLTQSLAEAAPGTILESQSPRLFAAALKKLAATGPIAVLVIDYGHTSPSEGDTLQAVRAHSYEGALTSPGEADLSAHVNFFELTVALHEAGLAIDGPVTQSEFLASLGIVERASRLMTANPARAGEIEAGVARLIAPNGMGTRFKVIAARSPELPPLPGFTAAR